MNTVLTPSAVWEGFDPYFGELESKILEERENFKRFVFNAALASDGTVLTEIEIYYPSFESRKTVLIIGEMERKVQPDVVEKLTAKGYNVVVPDYSGVWSHTETRYPDSLEYGYFRQGKEHLVKICPTAKETSFYLYSVVARRTVSFLESILGKTDVVVMGIKSGVDIALQVTGMDKRINGLVCVGGSGYREYANIPKYASGKELVIEGDMMGWLTGVSGTAYAKLIDVPVMVAVGSNGTISDIDRLSNFMSLIKTNEVSLTISSGCRDNILRPAFDTVLQWLEGVFIGSTPPELPTLRLYVNSEGRLCASVKTDGCIKIKEVRLFYAFEDNNHSTRFWRETEAEYSGDNEYLARIRVAEGEKLLFAYAESEYVNGLILDGVVNFLDLTDIKVKTEKSVPNPIVFQHPDENGFVELSDDAVIMNGHLCEGILPIGLKGLYCAAGGMVTYSIGRKKNFDETRLLQIDTYSAGKKYSLTLKAVQVEEQPVEYSLSREIEVGDSFYSLKLTPNDFKDEHFRAMENWNNIKSLAVCENNVIVGKIMFI